MGRHKQAPDAQGRLNITKHLSDTQREVLWRLAQRGARLQYHPTGGAGGNPSAYLYSKILWDSAVRAATVQRLWQMDILQQPDQLGCCQICADIEVVPMSRYPEVTVYRHVRDLPPLPDLDTKEGRKQVQRNLSRRGVI